MLAVILFLIDIQKREGGQIRGLECGQRQSWLWDPHRTLYWSTYAHLITGLCICNEYCGVRISKALAWGSKCPDFAKPASVLTRECASHQRCLILVCFPSRDYRYPLFKIYHGTLKHCNFIFLGSISFYLGNFCYFPSHVSKSFGVTCVSDLIMRFYISDSFFKPVLHPGMHH